jgi:hypothetical protein
LFGLCHGLFLSIASSPFVSWHTYAYSYGLVYFPTMLHVFSLDWSCSCPTYLRHSLRPPMSFDLMLHLSCSL